MERNGTEWNRKWLTGSCIINVKCSTFSTVQSSVKMEDHEVICISSDSDSESEQPNSECESPTAKRIKW